MDDIARGHDMRGPVVGAHDELAVGGQVDGLASQFGSVRQLDPHPRPHRGRVGTEIVDHTGTVAESGRKFSQQPREHTVTIAGSPALDHRGCPRLALDRTDVDPDADHDTGLIARDELGQDTGELARCRTLDRDEIIGPLCQHADPAELVDGRPGRGTQGSHHRSSTRRRRGNTQAHEERVTGNVLPDAVEPTPSGGLMIGDEHCTGGIAAPRLGDQIGIRRPGRGDVTQRPGSQRGRSLRTQGQKAVRRCRIRGVHSTNH